MQLNSFLRAPRKQLGWSLNLIISLTILLSGQMYAEPGWEQLPQILAQIVPPQFPARDFVITAYGAVGDGQVDNTVAFQAAIAACHQAGGGRVVVPAGVFLTGAIHLKSNVNLHLAKGATILFSRDYKKYLPVVYTRFEGVECYNYSPFIYAFEQENLAITGEGVLDGNADTTIWWPWAGKKEHGYQKNGNSQNKDRDLLFAMAEKNLPVEKRIFGAGHYLRPNFIQFYKCKNILIDGVQIVRSPMWEIHPVLCENVTVQNVTIVSHGPNNDGCNPESSKNVLVRNSLFDTGDDCIAIKSGRDFDGRRINRPSENIIIQNCIMKDGHGGVVIGSEMSGSVRNVFAEDCQMDSPNLDRALRIKTNSLRGGAVEGVFMRRVRVGKVAEAVILISMFYAEGDIGPRTPTIRNIFVEDVTSQSSKYALLLEGYERAPITNVKITNCQFNGVTAGNLIKNVKDLQLENVYINGKLVK